jgi:hypothetical protein
MPVSDISRTAIRSVVPATPPVRLPGLRYILGLRQISSIDGYGLSLCCAARRVFCSAVSPMNVRAERQQSLLAFSIIAVTPYFARCPPSSIS